MKKLKGLLLFAVAVVGLAAFSKADDYTLALSTYVPTGSAGEFTSGGYPNISGGAKLRTIILSNGGATAQDVYIYDTCTSSTTATQAGVFSLPAAIGTTVIDVPWRTWKLTDPCMRKSATGSTVNATLLYE